MKFLKYGALGVLAVLVLLLGVSLTLPSKWHVERRVEVKASPEAVLPFVENLRAWEQWTTWKKEDPEAQYTFTGSERGAGATMSWVGKKVGTGTLTVKKADLAGVGYEMSMESSQTPSVGTIAFAAKDGLTTVTWVDDGDFGNLLPARYFVGMMERMLGEQFGIALENLKGLAEKEQVALEAKEKARVEAEAAAERAAEEKHAEESPVEAPAATAEVK